MASSMSQNLHQWPSIEHLHASICAGIAWKIKSCQTKDLKPAQDVRTEIDLFIAQLSGFAVEKIDGTNLGIDRSGELFGRRLQIESSAQVYQKTPLSTLRSLNVGALYDALVNQVSGSALPQPAVFRLYGELGCNSLYDYTSKGYYKSWRCFGAVMRLETAADKELWVNALDAGHFLTRTNRRDDATEDDDGRDETGGSHDITLVSCDAFFQLLDACEIPHPQVLFSGSLLELVEAKKEWMCLHDSEGLVVSTGATLLKWKQGHEPQETGKLKGLLENEEYQPYLSEGVAKLLRILLEVATDKKPEPRRVGPKIPKPAKVVKDYSVHDDVIVSAVTKFDSCDAFFAKGNAGREEYHEKLQAEVLSDIGSNGDATEASMAVRIYVGKRYGEWVKHNK
ncbi:hypothetical protein HDU81_010840 [Chytriomyces hyalinus]|nr:hypothetical protein HDU81_010840 [Chytriomyces hyalinus]